MKSLTSFHYLLVISVILTGLPSCESDPEIDMGTPPIPYCYAIFDKGDSVHNIIIMKTFHGNPYGPYHNARIFDSIYFSGLQVDMALLYSNTPGLPVSFDTVSVNCIKELGMGKKPGVFYYPDFEKFTLTKSLERCSKIVARINSSVSEPLDLSCWLISPPKLIYPQTDGSMITITRTVPLKISWTGFDWNEVEINFTILSKYDETERIDTLRYLKTAITIPVDYSRTFETDFTYYTFLSVLNSQIDNRQDVVYRKFLDISVKVSCGSGDFGKYIKNLQLYSDEMVSALESKPLSLFTSKSHKTVSQLSLNQESIDALQEDTKFRKLKFVFW